MHTLWIIIHVTGVIFAAGAVTTAYARELYFKHHPEEAASRGRLPVVSTLINIGFVLVILSGFALYLEDSAEHNAESAFWIKMGAVALLLLNHIAINAFLREQKEKYRLAAAFSDYFSLFGWYGILILSYFL